MQVANFETLLCTRVLLRQLTAGVVHINRMERQLIKNKNNY